MRIYMTMNASKHIWKFSKSMEEAKKIINAHEETHIFKKRGSVPPVINYERGWQISPMDFDPTKHGFLQELNLLSSTIREYYKENPMSVPSLEDQERMEDARLLADDVDRLSTELAERNRYIERLEKADGEVRKSQMCPNITPPIQYPDNFPENKTGKCLHCKKEIGWLLHIGN